MPRVVCKSDVCFGNNYSLDGFLVIIFSSWRRKETFYASIVFLSKKNSQCIAENSVHLLRTERHRC